MMVLDENLRSRQSDCNESWGEHECLHSIPPTDDTLHLTLTMSIAYHWFACLLTCWHWRNADTNIIFQDRQDLKTVGLFINATAN